MFALLFTLSLIKANEGAACFYLITEDGYKCVMMNGNYQNVGDEFNIVHFHQQGFTNINVTLVTMSPDFVSTFRFIPNGIFNEFPNLFFIELPRTGIQTINSVQSCVNVEKFSLMHNNIQALPSGMLENCGNLRVLALEGNMITSIAADAFRALPRLEILLLRNNSITTLNPNTFNSILQLQEIDFAYNQISELPINLFITWQSRLTHIDFSNNQVSRLNSNSFSAIPTLFKIRFNFNQVQAIERNIFGNWDLIIIEALGNICVDQVVYPRADPNFLVPFENCFQNWQGNQPTDPPPTGFPPPITTTPPPGEDTTAGVTPTTVAPTTTTTDAGSFLTSKIQLIVGLFGTLLIVKVLM